ncbi:MAG: cyclic nucleotide-binding domain-containing protein [Desulfobacterales bacterium]|nr:cyclic nucleotide-binding domain-containing protein [Desulfobacterales bacterium]MCP4162375.1 cyclic nucleotide-binding domain-containing protein [Deltaproteobacteria bacterium]
MISVDDLRKIDIFSSIDNEMIEQILPYVELNKYNENEVIFKEDDVADVFFMLKKGTVLLEQSISDKITVTVGTISQGDAFGWSSIIDEGLYTTKAVCSDYCEVYIINGEAITDLLDKNHTMGYQLMQKIMNVLKERLNHRTDQFIRAITAHSEINALE